MTIKSILHVLLCFFVVGTFKKLEIKPNLKLGVGESFIVSAKPIKTSGDLEIFRELDKIKAKRKLRQRVKKVRNPMLDIDVSRAPRTGVLQYDNIPVGIKGDWTTRVHDMAVKSSPWKNTRMSSENDPENIYDDVVPGFVSKADLPPNVSAQDATILITVRHLLLNVVP